MKTTNIYLYIYVCMYVFIYAFIIFLNCIAVMFN